MSSAAAVPYFKGEGINPFWQKLSWEGQTSSCLNSVLSLPIYVCTHLPAPVLTGLNCHCPMEVGGAAILTAGNRKLWPFSLDCFINFMSSDIWYHKSIQPQRWGFYKYFFSHKENDSIQVTKCLGALWEEGGTRWGGRQGVLFPLSPPSSQVLMSSRMGF